MRRTAATLIALVALATLVTYAPAMQDAFVNYDDDAYVTQNERVLGGLTPANATWALTTFQAANWHPLTWLSLELDGELFGQCPAGYHLTSLLLHVCTSCLLAWTLWWLTGALAPSTLVAGLFALHPLHVESVAWAAERKDVLSGFFFVLILLCYARYARKPNLRSYLGVALVLALGLCSKAMLVTVPFLLLLVDFWPLGRIAGMAAAAGRAQPSFCPHVCWQRAVLEKVPLAVLASGAAALTWFAQREGGAVRSLEEYPIAARMANAAVAYVTYGIRMVYPVALGPFYPQKLLTGWMVCTAAAILLVITTLSVWAWRRRPYCLVGWFWYLGMLVPVIGLVQVGLQATADRYTYLPLVGIFIVLAWGAADFALALRLGRLTKALTSVTVLAVCALITRQQLGFWKNDLTLWQHAVIIAPDSDTVHNNLGRALDDEQRHQEALAHYQWATKLNQHNAFAHYNLGKSYGEAGNNLEAVSEFAEAVRLQPQFAMAENNLGLALARSGTLEAAVPHFEHALEIKPDYALAHNNLGRVLLELGRSDEAILHLDQAVRLAPAYAPGWDNRGIALSFLGKSAEALACFQEATRLAPHVGSYWFDLAYALAALKQREASTRAYGTGLALDPQLPEQNGQRAWQYATHPDPHRRNGRFGVRLAEEACEATGYQDSGLVAVLAAAYAEAGRLPEAIAASRRALRLAQARRPDLAATIENQQRLYLQGKPLPTSKHSPLP